MKISRANNRQCSHTLDDLTREQERCKYLFSLLPWDIVCANRNMQWNIKMLSANSNITWFDN